ncbi:MAG: multidrug DMT transporter permease [Halobacteriota archaeon]
MNVEFELLVSRLRWPIASTRWWAMQELSLLLQSADLGATVSTRLLEELRRCRLEAEVVEVLCIFWMAAMRGYALPSDLSKAVLLPSVLASLLLEAMGISLSQIPSPSLRSVPANFDVPLKFFEVQGFQVPKIYLTRLRQLESYSGLPFVQQCGFEWAANQEAYPDAPFQGDLSYFIRTMGDGMVGAFSSRAMLRMLSAYQRTLAVARQHWRAPEDLMHRFSLDALPIDPTLAFLRPARPSWLLPLGKYVGADAASVEAFIGQTTQALEATNRGSVLLALATPTYVSNEEMVELSVVRWRQWATVDINAELLEERFRSRIESRAFGGCNSDGVGTRTVLPVLTLDMVVDEESQAAPMAAVFGIDRLAYLQRDLYPNRLYYPVLTGSHAGNSVEPMGEQLSICSDRGQLATVSYWNAGWGPVHPASTGGLCGTALVGVCDQLQDDAETRPLRYFYLWRLRRFRRPSSYGEFAEEVLTGLVVM